MIDLTARGQIIPNHIPEVIRFRVPALGNPLFDSSPVNFVADIEGMGQAHIQSVVDAMEIGDEQSILDEMVARCHRDVARYPQAARSHANLGVALLHAGSLGEAARELEAALALDSTSYLALSTLARTKVSQDDVIGARALAHRLQSLQSDSPHALVILAWAAEKDGDTDTSVRLLGIAVEYQPNVVVLRVSLAQGLLHLRRYQEAVHQLKIAARSAGASADIYQLLGTAYILAEDMSRAERAFHSALTLAPDSPEVVRGLATMLLQQDRVNEMITLLQPYLKTHKGDSEAHELLAAAYMKLGQYSSARTHLFHALTAVSKDGPQMAEQRARLSNSLGVCYWHLKDQQQARQMFARAIEASPSLNVNPYYNLARLHLNFDQSREAEHVLRDSLRYFPKDAESSFYLAQALARQDRYDAAIDALQGIVEGGEATVSIYGLLSGLLADSRGDLTGAHRLLEKALRQFPDDAGILNNVAYVYLLQGDVRAAQAALERATPYPDEETALVLPATRGLLHVILGDLKRGREGYEEAAQAALRLGHKRFASTIRQKMHLELARAYRRQGDRSSMKREVRNGLKETAPGIYRQHLVALTQEAH